MQGSPIAIGNGMFTVIDSEFWAEVQAMGDWYITGFGYVAVTRKKKIYLHIWIYNQIDPSYTGLVDHKDTNRLNNLRNNLRPATSSQNKMNSNLRSTNTSTKKGVSWDNKQQQWRAYLVVNYKQIHLGYFDSFREAVAVRRAAAIHYFGEFAREES